MRCVEVGDRQDDGWEEAGAGYYHGGGGVARKRRTKEMQNSQPDDKERCSHDCRCRSSFATFHSTDIMSSSVGVPVLLNCSRSLRFIITGAAHGLGRGLARTLLAAGHDVFIMDSDSGELQYTLQTHLPSVKPASKGRFAGATCDITDPHNVQAALRQAHAFHRDGRCDVLVNNAARADPYWKSIDSLGNAQSSTGSKDALAEGVDPSADAVWQEWRAFVDTNLSGAFLVTRMCLGMLGRGMATEKGPSAAKGSEDDFRPSVIFVSSARAVQSEPNHEGYAST